MHVRRRGLETPLEIVKSTAVKKSDPSKFGVNFGCVSRII